MADDVKLAELTAMIQAVKDRVRARYPETSAVIDAGKPHQIAIPLVDLTQLVRARDAAQAKMASIGSVNPRGDGPVNAAIQLVKKAVARSLGWFVRDQVTFNREVIACIEAATEALSDANRSLSIMAGAASGLQVLQDAQLHWMQWRAEWEKKLMTNEVYSLRGISELQGAFQHRVTQIEVNFRESLKAQHGEYQATLERGTHEIQQRLWADVERIRLEYERLIHGELRVFRQRALATSSAAAVQTPPVPASVDPFDYQRFSDRFRGTEEHVAQNLEFYRPYFEGRLEILDIGCGRGEFLQRFGGRGIDLSEESVAYCKAKGLSAEVADLFSYLRTQGEFALDGIFCSQVVEHLAPERIPELVRLCAGCLKRGGVLVIETPNPECLAIFATHFYLDPTHTRPVPSALLAFYLEEFGMGGIEVHHRSPAVESMPELDELPVNFRNRFFGGLDYAIAAKKL